MSELLAPAGGMESLIAAVRCGADAVYLGAGDFNARKSAENFGGGGLKSAIAYCHERGAKVHVTLNTLLRDGELSSFMETADAASKAGADAVILQDLAAAKLFRERWPDVPRHASTQMAVHDLDGAKKCADMGYARVVLARELTLREIEHITAKCGIETEVFIHGALCMCVSGACYLSSMLGGRSGNRGLCAQPCRLDFTCRGRDHALSLKDLSALHELAALRDIGVASFKIEGRMKRPEYVAAAVTAARAALNGESYDEDTLRAVFSRGGFTDGYLTGKRGVAMFGYRGKDDVTAASGVLRDLSRLYEKEPPRVPVDMRFTFGKDGAELTVTDGERTAEASAPPPERAVNRPLTDSDARERLSKTGGTPYIVNKLDTDIEDGFAMSAAAMNALRRDALESLSDARAKPMERTRGDFTFPNREPYKADRTTLRARFQKAEQLCGDFDKYILPVREIIDKPELIDRYGDKLLAELPALLFDGDRDRLYGDLAELKRQGLAGAVTENIYGIELLGGLGLDIHGGAGLNILNTEALMEYAALGLTDATVSFELPMKGVAALGGELPRGMIGYGRLPLMRFRNCPAKGKNGCGDCDGYPTLTDRRGTEFPLVCGEKRFGTLLNSVPLYIADKQTAPVDFVTLYFTNEARGEIERVTKAFREKAAPDFARTGGLYYRTLL